MSILQSRHCPHCGAVTYHRLKSRFKCQFVSGDVWECIGCEQSEQSDSPHSRPAPDESFALADKQRA